MKKEQITTALMLFMLFPLLAYCPLWQVILYCFLVGFIASVGIYRLRANVEEGERYIKIFIEVLSPHTLHAIDYSHFRYFPQKEVTLEFGEYTLFLYPSEELLKVIAPYEKVFLVHLKSVKLDKPVKKPKLYITPT